MVSVDCRQAIYQALIKHIFGISSASRRDLSLSKDRWSTLTTFGQHLAANCIVHTNFTVWTHPNGIRSLMKLRMLFIKFKKVLNFLTWQIVSQPLRRRTVDIAGLVVSIEIRPRVLIDLVELACSLFIGFISVSTVSHFQWLCHHGSHSDTAARQ